MKEWTKQECEDLIHLLCKRYGFDVKVVFRNRATQGTFKVKRDMTPGAVLKYDRNPRIFLANMLWTGEYERRDGTVARFEVKPCQRLWTVLHEVAHAMNWALNYTAWYNDAHGMAWRQYFRQLCCEHGWNPVFTPNCKIGGHIDGCKDTNDGHFESDAWNVRIDPC